MDQRRNLLFFLPYADEFNVDVDAEATLERSGLFPAEVIRARIHLVGEGDLLVIARW